MSDLTKLHILSGAIWRLEHYGYIKFECPDEETEQMNHWIELMHGAIEQSRIPTISVRGEDRDLSEFDK